MNNRRHTRIVLVMFTIAALLYNSWPLGYWLNSKTARYGLASDLAEAHQPYYWLFLLGDILVGVSLLVITLLMRVKLKGELWSKSWVAVVVGLLTFGLFTATSAASPNSCLVGHIHFCATIHNKTFGPDGLQSSLAAAGLFISLIGVNVVNAKFKLNKYLNHLSRIILLAWTAAGLIFLWAADKNDKTHIAQQLLLITTGLALLIIGLDIYSAIESTIKTKIE